MFHEVLYVADAMVVAGLVVGIVAAVAAIVAAVAAIYALYYAKMAPTAADLRRIEVNTAETATRVETVRTHMASLDERQHLQLTKEALIARAQRVSIVATSDNSAAAYPFEISLAVNEPGIVPARIELFNEAGNCFGSFPCKEVRQGGWTSTVPSRQFQHWHEGGSQVGLGRMRVKLRVFLLIEEHEAPRDFAVIIMRDSSCFTLAGRC